MHQYPYQGSDRLWGIQLSREFELSASNVPPSGSVGGAGTYKQWMDTSTTPATLRMCVVPRATAGAYVANQWVTLGTITPTQFNYQGGWTGDLHVHGNFTADGTGVFGSWISIYTGATPGLPLDVGGAGNRLSGLPNPAVYAGAPGNNGFAGAAIGPGPNGNGPFIAASLDGNGVATPLLFYTNNTERMRLDTAGKLGIRTLTPSVLLDIDGGGSTRMQYLSNMQAFIGLGGGANNFGGLVLGAGVNGNAPTVAASFDGNGNPLPLLLYTSGLERVRINAGGGVGIGNPNPGALLDVGTGSGAGATRMLNLQNMQGYFGYSSVSAYGGVALGSGANGNTPTIAATFDGSGNPLSLNFWTNGVFRAQIAPNGWIGVGVAPAAPLDIGGLGNRYQGLNNSVLYAAIGGAAVWGGIILGSGPNGNGPFVAASLDGNGAALPLSFYTNGVSRMQIATNGTLSVGGTIVGNSDIVAANDIAAHGIFRLHTIPEGGGVKGARIECYGGDWDSLEFAVSSGVMYFSSDNGANGVHILGTVFSDVRLKDNIRDTAVDALEVLRQTPVRAFEWNEEGRRVMPHDNPVACGLVAQEVEETMPIAVGAAHLSGDMLYIDDQRLTPYLIRAIQQIADRLDAGGL